MEKHLPDEDGAHVLALAVASWGGAVALAAADGVFSRLPPEMLAAAAIFALAYAPAMLLVDRALAASLARLDARVIGAMLVILVVLLAGLALSGEGPLLVRLGQEAGAVAAFFVGPLTGALAIAILTRPLAPSSAAKSAPAKSPGASPAAT